MSDAPEPREFYTKGLPEQWNRTLREQERAVEAEQRLLEGMRAANASLRATVGDESFHLEIVEGRLATTDTPAAEPLVTLEQERADFERLVADTGSSALGFLGLLAGLSGDLKLTRARIEALAQLTGSIRFEIGGDRGFSLIARFDATSKPDPDTTVRIPADVYADLKTGSLDAPNAFMTGQIEVEGDMQLAMQLALSVLAPD